MKPILTSILIIFYILTNAQDLSKKDKAIIMSIGAGITTYGFFRSDETIQKRKTNNMICISGVVFAAIPMVCEKLNSTVYVSSHGVRINVRFGNECKYVSKHKKYILKRQK